jgi:hypothetical protein
VGLSRPRIRPTSEPRGVALTTRSACSRSPISGVADRAAGSFRSRVASWSGRPGSFDHDTRGASRASSTRLAQTRPIPTITPSPSRTILGAAPPVRAVGRARRWGFHPVQRLASVVVPIRAMAPQRSSCSRRAAARVVRRPPAGRARARRPARHGSRSRCPGRARAPREASRCLADLDQARQGRRGRAAAPRRRGPHCSPAGCSLPSARRRPARPPGAG